MGLSISLQTVSAADRAAVEFPAPYPFRVGEFVCTVLYDTTARYDPAAFFINAPAGERAAALAPYGLAYGQIASPYEALLVRTRQHAVLIDTGAGPPAGDLEGRLSESLNRAECRHEEIDTVILTHGHLDHIGGTLTPAGEPAFPRARYVMFRQEWEFWDQESPDLSSLGIGEEVRQDFIAVAHAQLRPQRERIELLDGGAEVRPGIYALFAGGHTPGHMLVRLESRGENLLYVSDLVLHPAALEHPEWYTKYEWDLPNSQARKRQYLDLAAREQWLVHAMHFAYPSLGHVRARADHWTWEAVAAGW